MNNSETTVEMLFQKAEYYGKTTVALFKLKAINKSADIVSSLASRVIISIVVLMFLLFLNVGIALWIGDKTDTLYLGFFIVAGAYLIIALLFYIFRYKWIEKPVSNRFINKLLEQ